MIAPSVMLGAFLFRLRLRLGLFACGFADSPTLSLIRLGLRLCLADMLGGGVVDLMMLGYVMMCEKGELELLEGNWKVKVMLYPFFSAAG